MRFASLFAGIGGFDLALEMTGMESVLQCEIGDHDFRRCLTVWAGALFFTTLGGDRE